MKAPFPWFGLNACRIPLVVVRFIVTIEQRFWAKVRKTCSCWIWTASKRNKGYGAFAYMDDGRLVQDRAHRFSFKIHKGVIPEGMNVLHNCPGGDNPACVNPAHLYLGTIATNNTDTIKNGRYNHSRKGSKSIPAYPRGENHPNSKLTALDVVSIRKARASGESFGSMSRRLGLSVGHLFRIVNRKVWTHV